MIRPIVLLGGGEHARVVAEAVRTRPELFDLRGFVDPAPCDETVRRLDIERLGDESALADHADAFGVIAVGDIALRQRLVASCAPLVGGFATVVHGAAWVSPTAELGKGAVVMAGAVVQTGARVRAHAIINSGSVIEHDVEVGELAHVAPGSVVGGGARIGDRAFIGLGASVRDHVKIGDAAVIGMGAIVRHDVPAGARMNGAQGP